jgi:hypothetical protein
MLDIFNALIRSIFTRSIILNTNVHNYNQDRISTKANMVGVKGCNLLIYKFMFDITPLSLREKKKT